MCASVPLMEVFVDLGPGATITITITLSDQVRNK